MIRLLVGRGRAPQLGAESARNSDSAQGAKRGDMRCETDLDPESALVTQARDGDMEAWARLYQLHYPVVYRRLRLLTGRQSVAEELSQECFVQAMLNLAKYRSESRFSTWLHAIAHNLVRNHWRSAKSTEKAHDRLQVVDDVRAQGRRGLDREFVDQRKLDAIYEALTELPEHLRIAFILRDIEGLSAKEAAASLGVTANNLAVRATRARTRVREILIASGWMEQNHE